MKKIIRKIRNLIAITASMSIMVLCSAGCIGCRGCGENNNGKPVAPDVYSNESGQSGEPSLPFFKPWWKD